MLEVSFLGSFKIRLLLPRSQTTRQMIEHNDERLNLDLKVKPYVEQNFYHHMVDLSDKNVFEGRIKRITKHSLSR